VPPKQCPACGRFLKNAFVEALHDAAAACPACGGELVASMFVVDATGATDSASPTVAAPAAGAASGAASVPGAAEVPGSAGPAGPPAATEQVSVRPPDLEPATVRDTTRDVLAGWDVTADAAEIASWQRDRRPFPTDTVVVVGAGALGAIAGGLIGASRRPRRVGAGIAGGSTLGFAVAVISRRIWRLS
jgi:hypothetical protein